MDVRKKCPPNKPLYNPKTNRCVTDNALNRKKLGLMKKTQKVVKPVVAPAVAVAKPAPVVPPKKKCPPNKPLYNPKTNRCVTDNALNRKKLGLVSTLNKPKPKPSTKIVTVRVPTIPEDADLRIKYAPCKNKILFSKLDLSNIDFVGPNRLGDKYNKKFYLTYTNPKTNKTTVLVKKQLVGSGTYGDVYHCSDSNGLYHVAMKETRDYYDDEYTIIEHLKKNKVDCKILNGTIVNFKPNKRVAVFEYFNGSLHDLQGKLKLPLILAVAKQLVNDIYCLFKKGLYYYDLKLGNILYKCVDKESIHVTRGDVGSLCKKK